MKDLKEELSQCKKELLAVKTKQIIDDSQQEFNAFKLLNRNQEEIIEGLMKGLEGDLVKGKIDEAIRHYNFAVYY